MCWVVAGDLFNGGSVVGRLVVERGPDYNVMGYDHGGIYLSSSRLKRRRWKREKDNNEEGKGVYIRSSIESL